MMIRFVNVVLKLAFVPVLMLSFMGAPTSVEAASKKSPFLQLAGKWRGGGRVTPPGGTAEKVRCRVSYRVFGSGNKAVQKLRCAGNGYWITATTKLRYTPGTRKIRGTLVANYGDKSTPKKKSRGVVSGDYIGNVISLSLATEQYTSGIAVHLLGKRKHKFVINNVATLHFKR